MNVCFTCDGNYLRALEIAVYSLLDNYSDKCFIHIVKCSDFNEETIRRACSVYDADVCFYEFKPELKATGRFTSSVYARLYLDEILGKDIDTVLYLDCDLVVQADIAKIFELQLNGYCLAAVSDIGDSYTRNFKRHNALAGYFNAGVLLLNMKMMREDGVFKSARGEFAHGNKYLDQDMLNLAVGDRWLALDEIYNYMRPDVCPAASVIHFAHCKPWEFFSYNKNKFLYFNYSESFVTDTADMKMNFQIKRVVRNFIKLILGWV